MGKTFDPAKAPTMDDGNEQTLPAGEYLLAMVFHQRRISKAGSPYLRAKYEVVSGPLKGATFWDSLSLKIESRGVAARLGVYCKAVGQTEPFDIDDDYECRKAFWFRPFKAEVSVEKSGDYVNNRVKRYVLDVSDEERAIMDTWVLDHEDKRQEYVDDYALDEEDRDRSDYTDDDDDIPF